MAIETRLVDAKLVVKVFIGDDLVLVLLILNLWWCRVSENSNHSGGERWDD